MTEEEQWAEDRRNGTLDDPVYPDWKIPNCSQCTRKATLAFMERSYSLGTLDNPPYPDAVFYCEDHYPEKCK